MLALNFLRLTLTRLVLIRIEMTGVGTPIIGVIARDSKRLQQRFELQKYLIFTATKDVREDLAIAVVNGMPQPPLLLLTLNITPHFVHFSFLSESNDNFNLIWVQQRKQVMVHIAECRFFFLSSLITVAELIFNTRTVSRMPLPLRAMSTICS